MVEIQQAIKHARSKKVELEKKIGELLSQFSRETGILIDEIYVWPIYTESEDVESYSTHIRVEIDGDYIGD